MMTDAQIVDAWIAEISIDEGLVDPARCSDAAWMIDDIIIKNPKRAWSIITKMSAGKMSSWATENFSAGPLTTFVYHHGQHFAESIRSYCINHPEFSEQLLGVVFQDRVRAILYPK